MKTKNAMLLYGWSVLGLITTCTLMSGCESAVSGASTLTGVGNSAPLSSASLSTCTVTSAVGGVNVSCPDGSNGFLANGSAGGQGIQGLKGATGGTGSTGAAGTNAVKYVVRDNSGVIIGTRLGSISGQNGIAQVFDDDDGVFAEYSQSTRQLASLTTYYADAGCTTMPLIPHSIPQNFVFQGTDSIRYKVATTVVTPVILGQKSQVGGACTNPGGYPTGNYSQTAVYIGSTLPLAVIEPLRVEKQ